MSLEDDLFAALGPLVSSRVYPLTFDQPAGGLPVWPAIRYTIVSSEFAADVCGDGGDAVADKRVQLDLVAATYAAVRTLRLAVLSAMEPFAPPTLHGGEGETFDEQTRTYRVRLDYLIYPSSGA